MKTKLFAMNKRLTTNLFLIVLFMSLFGGCKQTADYMAVNSNAFVVNLDTVELKHDFKLSNIFDSIKVIPLDNSEVVIGKLNRVDIYKDLIIVLDAEFAKGVFAFDRAGKLLYQIGNVGLGPEEYASCGDFAIDREQGSIYIYDKLGHRIYVYDVNTGKYQRTLSIERSNKFNRIWCNGGNLYAVRTYFLPKKDNSPFYILKQLDEKTGELLGEWLDVETFNKGWKKEFLTTNLFYRLGEDVDLFAYGIADTILCLKEGKIAPYMVFTGDKVIKPGDLSEEEKDISLDARKTIEIHRKAHRRLGYIQQKITSVFDLYGNNGNLYFDYMTWPCFFTQYNLEKGEISVYTYMKDDLLFLSKPYKYTMTSFLMSDADGVYYQVNTEVLPHLKSCLDGGFLSDRIKNKDVLQQITEDSNPIILYYEFKKE